VVARTELPGKVTMLNLANVLGVQPDELDGKLTVQGGGAIARARSSRARPASSVSSRTRRPRPSAARIESVSAVTGMAVLREPPIPVEVTAYIDGTVVEVIPDEGVVIEAKAALVQGIFGLAGERQAPVVVVAKEPGQPLEAADVLPAEHAGKIIIGGGRATLAALRRAIELKVAAIVCGGFAYQDVKELLGYDVGVAVTGTEALATTLMVTEGFGDIAMARATFELLRSLDGRTASVNGATQIRAGVIRPEIIVTDAGEPDAAEGRRGLRGRRAGARHPRARTSAASARSPAMPHQLQVMPSETKVRVCEVDFGGDKVVLPRANVEVIER
jgi:hypothetical protein